MAAKSRGYVCSQQWQICSNGVWCGMWVLMLWIVEAKPIFSATEYHSDADYDSRRVGVVVVVVTDFKNR